MRHPDGNPKAKGKRPKQDKKSRKPTERNESTSKAPLKSKTTNQAEPGTMHQVEMGIEGESEPLLSGIIQAMQLTMAT
jgi:hypothetical protein